MRRPIFTLCKRAATGLALAMAVAATASAASTALPGGAPVAPTSTMAAGAHDDLRNFGNDPFLHISSAVADCPVPLGPFMRVRLDSRCPPPHRERQSLLVRGALPAL